MLSAHLGLVLASIPSASWAGSDPRGIADLYRSGEERVWAFEQEGRRIGHHVFRYEGTVDPIGSGLHRFTGRVRVDAMPALEMPEQRYTGELLTDDAGHPVRSVLEAELGDSYSRVELTFDSGKAAAVILKGAKPTELSVDVPKEAFLQANNFIGYHELMIALAPREEDGGIRAKLFSSNVLQIVPYTAKSADGKLEDSLGETISLTENGRIRDLEVKAQKLRITSSDERPDPFVLARPRVREAPRDFDVEPVVIRRGAVVFAEDEPGHDEEHEKERGEEGGEEEEEHAEAVLAGEITRPKGAKGRLPAVFFISGSGLQDRDGNSSGIDLGTREVLDHLTRAGFLVLRVDDRGAGASTGPLEHITYEEIVADARVCVDYLFAREDVDPERVVLIGHSEGGVTAPILAAERPVVAAVVLMAATARPIAEVILEQNERSLDRAGVQGEARQKILADVKRYLALAASDEKIDPEDVPADYRELLEMRRWLRGHARQNVRANVQRLRCPVLILQGGKDMQVSPEKDAKELAKALDEAKNEDHELVVFPELDHLFKKVGGKESTLAEYFQRRPIDREFLDTLTKWLSKRLRVEAPR